MKNGASHVTINIDGKLAVDMRAQVSTDGKTLTETADNTDAQGRHGNGALTVSSHTGGGTWIGPWQVNPGSDAYDLAGDVDGDGTAGLFVASTGGVGFLKFGPSSVSCPYHIPNGQKWGGWRFDTINNEFGAEEGILFTQPSTPSRKVAPQYLTRHALVRSYYNFYYSIEDSAGLSRVYSDRSRFFTSPCGFSGLISALTYESRSRPKAEPV